MEITWNAAGEWPIQRGNNVSFRLSRTLAVMVALIAIILLFKPEVTSVQYLMPFGSRMDSKV